MFNSKIEKQVSPHCFVAIVSKIRQLSTLRNHHEADKDCGITPTEVTRPVLINCRFLKNRHNTSFVKTESINPNTLTDLT